jgi:hypothetical protein
MSIPGSANPLLLATAAAADDAVTIERSLRFNNDDSAFLTRDPDTQGTRTTWTWSAWVKFSSADRKVLFAGVTNESNRFFILEHRDGVLDIYDYSMGVYNSNLSTSRVFADYSAWYHIVFTYDTTNSTADDRQRLYVNGEQITDFSSRTNPNANHASHVLSLHPHYLSGYTSTGTLPHDGYMAEVHLIDGQSLQASDFGEYDSNDVWQPKAYAGSHGTHGWHLNFSDATSTSTIGEDQSGNGNNWTATNISVTAGNGNDSVFDSPENGTQTDSGAGGEVSGNYCCLDYYGRSGSVVMRPTYENGNLLADNVNSSHRGCHATFAINSGKWYWEVYMHRAGTSNLARPGLVKLATGADLPLEGSGSDHKFMYYEMGYKGIDGTDSSYGATFATGDTIGVAFDADSGSLTFYKNGTSQGVATSSISSSDYPLSPFAMLYNAKVEFNFGQKAFSYSAPSGYKCLCTTNLATPAVARGSDHFDVVTYTGSGASKSITGLNFSPDLVIISNRGTTAKSPVTDSVRGVTKELLWDPTEEAESTNADGLTAFNSDGFTIGADALYNTSSGSYVAWAWNAGTGSAVSNTDGSATTSVKANTTAGLSIVSYAGTSATDTFGHGLNSILKGIILRRRDLAVLFEFFTTAIDGSHDTFAFNQTDAKTNSGITAPTSSVFSLINSAAYNTSGSDHIGYAMAEVEGFSKFGEYFGRGTSTIGHYKNFVNCGFRPRFLIVREYADGSAQAYIYDSERNTANPLDQSLRTTQNTTEIDVGDIYFLSNGFKIIGTSDNINQAGQRYFFMAFAEHPFKNARAF